MICVFVVQKERCHMFHSRRLMVAGGMRLGILIRNDSGFPFFVLLAVILMQVEQKIQFARINECYAIRELGHR